LCEQIADLDSQGPVAPYDVRLSDVDVVQPDLVSFCATVCSGRPWLPRRPARPRCRDPLARHRPPRPRIKKERYRAFGVREYWIVDPVAYVVEQFVLERGEYRSTGEHTASVDLHILPGARVDLTRVW